MNIPEGYVLVPYEPTCDQLFAGVKTSGVIEIYKDMVSAAPALKIPAYDEAKERELFARAMVELGRCNHVNAVLSDDDFYHFKSDWQVWKACAKSRARSAE